MHRVQSVMRSAQMELGLHVAGERKETHPEEPYERLLEDRPLPPAPP
jgi:hypothetical protein